MSKINSVFEWCLKQGKKGEKHKGLKKIDPNDEESKKHVNKALHNLKAIDHNMKKFPDWAVSAAFYAMYHALLATLFKLGYESRNQECTMNAVEHFIDKKEIEMDRKYIKMIRKTGKMVPTDAKSLREEFQYPIFQKGASGRRS